MPNSLIELSKIIKKGKKDAKKILENLPEDNKEFSEKKWFNKLIHGDNLQVMESLLKDDEIRGKIDLIYIDPPYNSGKSYMTKEKQFAYKDIWKNGTAGYLKMLVPRLFLMKELLCKTGSIYVHIDWRVAPYIRIILDEIFGKNNFRNEIIWWYKDPSGNTNRFFKRKHDNIYFYSKNKDYYFDADSVRTPYSEGTMRQAKTGAISFGRPTKINKKGKIREDVWEIPIINSQAKERIGYPTQKPENLLELIIKASSKKEDIIADFFCGSGTTGAVAEKLGRRWIMSDSSKEACRISKKRLINQGSEPFLFEDLDGKFKIKLVEDSIQKKEENNHVRI